MNQIWQILILVILALSKWSFAAGLEDALKICQSFSGDRGKSHCLEIVNKSQVYEVKAVAICASLFGDDRKLGCLEAIQGKNYTETEIGICAGVFGDEGKSDCLKQGGRASSMVLLNLNVINRVLNKALDEIQRGDSGTASDTIQSFLEKLNRPW